MFTIGCKNLGVGCFHHVLFCWRDWRGFTWTGSKCEGCAGWRIALWVAWPFFIFSGRQHGALYVGIAGWVGELALVSCN